MKIKIKLDKRKNLLNSEGYPLIINIAQGKQKTPVKTGFRAHPDQWDDANELPTKAHPKKIDILNYLHPKKAAIIKCESAVKNSLPGEVSITQVKAFIFGAKSSLFYNEALKLIPNDKHHYNWSLNSFNKYFPNLTFKQITPEVAKQYLKNISLETNKTGNLRSANGTHTYTRTLTALWGQLTDDKNPFKGVRPEKTPTASRALTNNDVTTIINTKIAVSRYDSQNNEETRQLYKYYWLLLFYLGGTTLKDLSLFRHDKHVIGNRLEYTRAKGGTNESCSNKLFKEARQILDKINELTNCYPYFTPINKYSYTSFRANFNKRFNIQCEKMSVTRKVTSYSARYTFINRAKQLGIDERVTMEIVGHSSGKTHGIYTDQFSHKVRDKAHKKIIRLA